MERDFVSGLPEKKPPKERTMRDALNDLGENVRAGRGPVAQRIHQERRRWFGQRQTARDVALTKRITGERDD